MLRPPFTDETFYDFVFFLRIDLVLKPLFASHVFRLDSEKILFPCACFIHWPGHAGVWHKCVDGSPRIADVMSIVPRKFYAHMHGAMNSFGHETWSHLAREHGMGKDQMGFLLRTYHDSDSYKDWNPIYFISDRPEHGTWYSVFYEMDEETLEPVAVPEPDYRARYSAALIF